MDYKKRLRSVKNRVNTLNKLGLEIDKATGGKNLEDIARSPKSYEKFLKQYNRVKERPKILEEIKKYEEEKIPKGQEELSKISKKIIDKTKINDKTKNIISKTEYNKFFPQYMNFEKLKNIKDINNVKSELNKIKKNPNRRVEEFTRARAKLFFNKYFKELTLSAEYMKKIDKLVNLFGRNLDILNDSINALVKKVEIQDMADTNDVRRIHGEKGKFKEMEHRFELLEDYLSATYDIRLPKDDDEE